MRRRLILSTALIALASVVILGIPLALVETARVRQENAGRLEREADVVVGSIEDRLEVGRAVTPRMLARLTPPHHRSIVSTRDGKTIASGAPLTREISSGRAGSSIAGRVIVQAPTAELEQRTRRVWILIGLLGAGGVLAAVALASLQARRLARPLEAIAERSAQLGDGDFSVRAGRFGVPEIDAIAKGLDGSAERIAELVAREREFSANASHQLRTPLTALRLRLEEVHRQESLTPSIRTDLEAALTEADRLEATIADLLVYARRAGSGRQSLLNLGTTAHEHAARWRPIYARANRKLEITSAKNVLVRVSPGTVGQTIDVLLDNALRYGRGTVRLDVTADGRAALLAVTDQGNGIEPADYERIFDRGASRAGGTGIGLHLARALVQADAGTLEVVPSAGTRIVLRLGRLAADYQ